VPGPQRSRCSRSWCNFSSSRSTRWASRSRAANARQGETFSPTGAKFVVSVCFLLGMVACPGSHHHITLVFHVSPPAHLRFSFACSFTAREASSKAPSVNTSTAAESACLVETVTRLLLLGIPSWRAFGICSDEAAALSVCNSAAYGCKLDQHASDPCCLVTRPVTSQSPEYLSLSPRRRTTFGDLQARSMEGGGGWRYARGGDLVSGSGPARSARTSARAPLPVSDGDSSGGALLSLSPTISPSISLLQAAAQHMTIAPGRFCRMKPRIRS